MSGEELERRRLELVEHGRRMRAPEIRATARATARRLIGEAIAALDAAAEHAGEAPGGEGSGIEDARILAAAAIERLGDADRLARRLPR